MRIDDIVISNRLDKEHLSEIAQIQLDNVQQLLGPARYIPGAYRIGNQPAGGRGLRSNIRRPAAQAGYPRLTLGGYLMREYRLLALQDLLNKAERDQLSVIVDRFLQIAADGVERDTHCIKTISG